MNIDDPRVDSNLNEMSHVLSETKDRELIESFLRCLLTPAETADIAARWALVKALKEGVPQREIARNLGLSLCKITRGSKELKKPGSAFQSMLKTLHNLYPEGIAKNSAPAPLDPHHNNSQNKTGKGRPHPGNADSDK